MPSELLPPVEECQRLLQLSMEQLRLGQQSLVECVEHLFAERAAATAAEPGELPSSSGGALSEAGPKTSMTALKKQLRARQRQLAQTNERLFASQVECTDCRRQLAAVEGENKRLCAQVEEAESQRAALAADLTALRQQQAVLRVKLGETELLRKKLAIYQEDVARLQEHLGGQNVDEQLQCAAQAIDGAVNSFSQNQEPPCDH